MYTNSQDNEKKNESDKPILNSTDRIADKADIDPKLLALLDQVCQSGEDALSELKAYTDETQAENAENAHPDVESSLKEFKELHAAAFATHKHTRVRRWGYRLCVIAAAIIVLNTLCIFAFGRSMYDYVAMWGSETFGYIMQTANPEKYDPDTYYNPNEQYIGKFPEIDTDSEDIVPVEDVGPDPAFANIPDTDVSAMGLKKTESVWDDLHTIENFRILNEDFIAVLKAFGVSDPVAPTWLPDSFVIDYLEVTKDYLLDTSYFGAYYTNKSGAFTIGITDLDEYGSGEIEKDDRPVILYATNGVDWYIMHNLDYIVASAAVNQREVLFCGPVTIDEMKKVIDSVYEGE